jgi:hypothetical protein
MSLNMDMARKMRAEGKSLKEICAALAHREGAKTASHSRIEREFMHDDIKSGVIKGGFAPKNVFESDTALGAYVVLRRHEGESWGVIAARLSEQTYFPEGRVRKAFANTAQIDSAGLRIGKGGRYVEDDARFYTGSDRPTLGHEFAPGQPRLAQVPDPEADEVRTLPATAAKLVKPKRVRKATTKA